MKIMVTGSRHWTDQEAIHSALMAAIGDDVDSSKLYVGDCPTGADAIAAGWWTAVMGVSSLYVVGARGRRPHQLLARNQLIVDHMPDVVLGFVLYGPWMSRGTNDALNRARENGLNLIVQERPAPADLIPSDWPPPMR
jgi:hypothetical protein